LFWNLSNEQLTTYPYIIIDDSQESILETKAMASRFGTLRFMGFASNYEEGLNLILEFNPKIVFLEIDPEDRESNLSLSLVNELYRYLKNIPKIIVTTKGKELAFDAIRHEVFDYLTKPLQLTEFRKAILKLERSFDAQYSFSPEPDQLPNISVGENHLSTDEKQASTADIIMPVVESLLKEETEILNAVPEDKPLVICVKSYGDYRFINASDICYLQADNNSTDIHLNNGEMITAFKTLKHFETVLHSPFVRIHNSYIVNIDYVSRIHTGNSVCYIKNTTTKLPFSKSYKENVDAILNSITKGNYLEI
jgi:DNA-binding LytR/AlgR family response regulator